MELKKLKFQLSGITAGQTRTLTVPDASCTIVCTNVAQTLTNKTLTDATNNIMAKSFKSATTTIDVSSATAPTTGQVLTATSTTNATWKTPDVSQFITMSAGTTSMFDITTVNANSKGFRCGVFDGRYVYLVPHYNVSYHGQITRYDTTLPFSQGSSYSFFNTESVNANSKGFIGGVFDGRYVYLVPNFNGVVSHGQITRYDTTLPFSQGSSYSMFDTATVNASSKGFQGCVFDGRYIYSNPYNNGGAYGQITRYDTTLPFSQGSSYSLFNTESVNANSKGFIGGVFDGRYVYLVPNTNGQITRYDTTLPFSQDSSYSFLNTESINASSKGFVNGVFDGRYVYFVPNSNVVLTRVVANQTINTNVNTVKPQLSLQYSINDALITTPTTGQLLTRQRITALRNRCPGYTVQATAPKAGKTELRAIAKG